MTEPPVLLEVVDTTAYVTLNRPRKLNAVNQPMVDALEAALAVAEADDAVRVVVLRGAGRAFSAGYDLSEEQELGLSGADRWHRLLGRDVEVTMRLRSFPKPVIASVHGHCLGGALELALAADILLAADDASFGEPEIRYGSGPVTLLLPFAVGARKAAELLLTGDTVDAAEAGRIGIANRVVPAASLAAETERLARRIAASSPVVLGFTKRALLRAGDALGVPEAVESNLDLAAIVNSAETPEGREFERIVAEEGMRAALRWRDARYADAPGADVDAGGDGVARPADADVPSTFRAFVAEHGETAVERGVRELSPDDLGPGDVTIRVEWSSVNYKDGLAATHGGRVARLDRIVPGIDLAGRVVASDAATVRVGSRVLVHGYDLGVAHHGGFAELARVPADWVVPLPEALDARQAMIVGTAGFTAALSVVELEARGLEPRSGPVLVLGASGGVGSVAVGILAARGYEVWASTGKEDARPYLESLGAHDVLPRAETSAESRRPLESERWAAAVDPVGGASLAYALRTMRYGGAAASSGLTGGARLETTMMPFILRRVSVLGIDSVQMPLAERTALWRRIAGDLRPRALDLIAREVGLDDLEQPLDGILRGEARGRTVVRLAGG